MNEIRQLAFLGSLDALRRASSGHYGDALSILGHQLSIRRPRKYVDSLIGILPPKQLRAPPEWIRLYAITSTGTEYAAVRGVEEALVRFYRETGMLVVVEPLRRRDGLHFKHQFPYAARVVAERGAVVYAND